jgi:flagellar basal-body rod modification protein FlgD
MTAISGTDAQASGAASSGAGAPPKTITPDLNMFLKMLTTQLQNQDPLNPMDTAQYTQQLVQYSQVEQEMQQTDTLNGILSNLASQGMSQASSFIGREARFVSDTAGLQGDSPATWTYVTDRKATQITATIKNGDGKVVAEVKLEPDGDGRFTWDGTTTDGSKAPDGAYTLALSALDDSGRAIETTINSVGIVKDVVTDGQNVMLGVNGLRFSTQGLVAVSEVKKG